MFWIAFQLGSLIGFIFLGIAAFKLTPEQMNVEAGKFQGPSTPLNVCLLLIYSFQRVFYQHSIHCSLCCLLSAFRSRLSSCLYTCLLVVRRPYPRGVTQCHKLLPISPLLTFLGSLLSFRSQVTDFSLSIFVLNGISMSAHSAHYWIFSRRKVCEPNFVRFSIAGKEYLRLPIQASATGYECCG